MKWIWAIAVWLVIRLALGAIVLVALGTCMHGVSLIHAVVTWVMASPVLKVFTICFFVGYFVCRAGELKNQNQSINQSGK